MFWPLVAAALLAVEPSPSSQPPPDAELPALPPPPLPAPRPRLVFAGNRVLPDAVYRAVLKLPDDFAADAEVAASIERTIARFLRDGGYELASVHVVAHDNQIDIGINEGRLEKVVYRGRLTFQTLRFTFTVEIPHEVFNRPMLEAQCDALAGELGLGKVWFVLVPTAALTHTGPQLEKLPEIKGIELLHEREPWELHFFFSENEWSTGAWLDIRTSYADGFEFLGSYQRKDLLLEDDRFRLGASIGAGVRRQVKDDNYYVGFSRASFEAKWYSPKLTGDLRPFVWFRSDFTSRQRRDLGLEDYNAATASGSVQIEHTFRPGWRISLGTGAQWQRIFGLSPGQDAAGQDAVVPPSIQPRPGGYVQHVRAFFEVNMELIFDPLNNRWDRRHQLVFEAAQYRALTGVTDPWYGYAHFSYQNLTPIGWHDFWLRSRGRTLWSDINFHNEDSVGEYTHGVFGDLFVRHAVNATGEFRFSLTRDILKVSLFHEVFAFSEIDRATGVENPRVGTAIGPGVHLLIEGLFQMDLFGSFGVVFGGRDCKVPGPPHSSCNGAFDAAINGVLLKVF